MFEGDAEKAMDLYVKVFPDSRIEKIERYGPDEGAPEGSVKLASHPLLRFTSPATTPTQSNDSATRCRKTARS